MTRRAVRGTIAAWCVVAASALSIARLRPAAVARFARLKELSDVYPLPPPEQVVVASLGYRSALADLIYASTLVSYGLHALEKRRLEFVGQYLDTINALDPTFRDPYHFADTLLVFSTQVAQIEHYEKAREVLLRGIENRPHDTDLWLQTGQFLAYLAPPNLHSPQLATEYRLQGGKILARACELANNDQNAPYGCVTAARILEIAGQREAAIESMKRLLTVTDDPEIEGLAAAYLRKRLDERQEDRRELRKQAFRDRWKVDLPFVSKDAMLVLGPRVDTTRCAGVASADEEACAATWRDWARFVDPDRPED